MFFVLSRSSSAVHANNNYVILCVYLYLRIIHIKLIYCIFFISDLFLLLKNQLKSLDQEKEVLITDNRNLAEENVNKEPEIVERKGRISELSEQGKALCTSVQEKLAEFSK